MAFFARISRSNHALKDTIVLEEVSYKTFGNVRSDTTNQKPDLKDAIHVFEATFVPQKL